jgi:hypothetical protein
MGLLLHRTWNAGSLVALLGVVATIPILQFASLGYMLESASRIARGLPANRCFPGASTAGRLATAFLCAFVTWLPIWLITDLAYTGELIEAGSVTSARLRVAARVLSGIWILWILWAVFRGGKLRHFLWPAPIYALKSLFRVSFWRDAEERLWNFVVSLRLPRLLWIGFTASLGALVWIVFPASLIVIGISAPGQGAGLVGLVGAIAMGCVLLYLPFLQVQMAMESKFLSMFDFGSVRSCFRKAPWAFLVGTWTTCLLALPLYILRIEPPPPQLWWILSLFFVTLMFPSRLACGWALRRSRLRAKRSPSRKDVHWMGRYIAWGLQWVAIGAYLGAVYLAKFALWEGAASVYLQHAFLPPVPFFLR